MLLFALKAALFSAGMGVAIHFFYRQFAFDGAARLEKIGILLATILVGVAAYMGLNLIFSRREVMSLKGLFSKRDETDAGDDS